MRIFLAILSGFVVALTIFASGALTAIFFINAEPVTVHPLDMDTSALWSSKPVKVNTDTLDFAGVPARPVLPQSKGRGQEPNEAEEFTTTENQIDMTTTAALSAENVLQARLPGQHEVSIEHVEWCLRYYRSYDRSDNRYTAYSGVRRDCISPYSDNSRPEEPETIKASAEDTPALITSAHSEEVSSANVDPEHIQSCFERYQSYRPEDNTYQPYGGGPRQHCK